MCKNRHPGIYMDFKSNSMKDFKFGQPRYPETSEEMWQSFYHLLPLRKTSSSDVGLYERQAIMWLYHRQRPDPLPYFQYLREVDVDEDHHSHKQSKQQGRNSRSVSCALCATLLAATGRHADARWVEDFVIRRLPETKRNWKRSFISPDEKRSERVKPVGIVYKGAEMQRVNRLANGKSICANPHHLLLLPNPCPSCGQRDR